jgi:polar amino acid transport system substrate-binding protein
MPTARIPSRREVIFGGGALSLAAALAACSSGTTAASAGSSSPSAKGGTTLVTVAGDTSAPYHPIQIPVPEVASIRAEVPASIRSTGKLVVGVGALPAGAPPLVYIGTDQKTLTGSEPDLGRLIAAVFGLQPEIVNSTWDNMFVGIDSGRTNVAICNIANTEQRQEKYDFASYRTDELAFEVMKSSKWNFKGNYENLAGMTVSVGSGTSNEAILLHWRSELQKKGKTINVEYLPDVTGTYLALESGRIDIFFSVNPEVQYHVAQDAASPYPTRNAGTLSGSGTSLQSFNAATTLKGNGLVKPLADAINYLIKNGQYAKWLAAYNLSNEAVPTARINPPGLPTSSS